MLKKKSKKKIFIFDMDDTICKTTKKKYEQSKPIKSIISKINSLKENGHTIKIFTARYMGRNKENYRLVKKNILRGQRSNLKNGELILMN